MGDENDGKKQRKLPAQLERSSWLLRWALEAPSRWLGRRSTVGQDIAGGADGLSYLRHLARGNRLQREAAFNAVPARGTAPIVLLIHGFLGTRGSMYLLERRLVEDGFVVVSFNIGALNVRDIRRSAFLIHRKIERILAESPGQKIDVIGHSMGGLIGLYYVKKLGGDQRVRKLIMMGSPARGTWIALAGVATLGWWSTSSWQLIPRSRFLDELAQGHIPTGTEVYTIAAARDWIVPPDRTRITGANATTVPLGHSSLVVSEDVYKRIIDVLKRDQPQEGGGAGGANSDDSGHRDHEG